MITYKNYDMEFKDYVKRTSKEYWDEIVRKNEEQHSNHVLLVLEDGRAFWKRPYFGTTDNFQYFHYFYPTIQYFWNEETGFWYSNNLDYLGIIPKSYNIKPNTIFLTPLQYEILRPYQFTSPVNLDIIKEKISEIN